MNKLKTRIAELLGVSESEKELAFDIFVNNVFQVLEPEETLKIPKIGFFQYKTKPINTGDVIIPGQISEGKNNLIYAPLSDDLPSDSKSMFLIINISHEKKDLNKLDENVFSIGVGKPILPISEDNNGDDTETYYVLLKKSIEERVGELISESEHLKNFDVWDDYVSMHIDESTDLLETESPSKFKLTGEFEYIEEEIISDRTGDDLIPAEDESEEKSPAAEDPEPEIPKNDFNSSQNFYESISDDVDSEQEDITNHESDELDKIEEERPVEEPEIVEEKEFSGLDEFKKTSEKNIVESEDDKVEWELDDNLTIDTEDKSEVIEDFEKVDEPVIKEVDDKSNVLQKDNSLSREKVGSGEFQGGLNSKGASYESTPDYESADDEKFNASFITKFIFIVISFAAVLAVVFLLIIPWINDQLIEDPPHGREVQFSEAAPTAPITDDNETTVKTQTDSESDKQSEDNTPEVVKNDDQIEKETPTIEEPVIPAETTQKGLYRNIPNESPVRGLIFTDGSKYFVQVSSWRNTEKAESEAERLRDLGYDAFIVEAYIPKFKSTWYRVKIGDFNSVSEAERFQQNNKF